MTSDADAGQYSVDESASSGDADVGADDDADSDSNDSEDGGGKAGPHSSQHLSFLEGSKSASFAKAFAKIMTRPIQTKQPKQLVEAAADATTAGAATAAAAADVILAESGAIHKRKLEEEQERVASRESKRQRTDRKNLGHVVSAASTVTACAASLPTCQWGYSCIAYTTAVVYSCLDLYQNWHMVKVVSLLL